MKWLILGITLLLAVGAGAFWWYKAHVFYSPPYPLSGGTYPDMEKQGQFGDAFNVATSLLTAFAIIGVVATLALQLLEMKGSEDAHTDQLNIAKQTAQLYALSFLSDLNYRLMESSKDKDLKLGYAERSNVFAKRCLHLLQEIDEANQGTVVVASPLHDGVQVLRKLYTYHNEQLSQRDLVDFMDSSRLMEAQLTMGAELARWSETYAALLQPDDRREWDHLLSDATRRDSIAVKGTPIHTEYIGRVGLLTHRLRVLTESLERKYPMDQ